MSFKNRIEKQTSESYKREFQGTDRFNKHALKAIELEEERERKNKEYVKTDYQLQVEKFKS